MKQNIFLLLFVSFFLFVNQIPVLGKEIIVYPGDQLDKIRDKARDGDCILLHEGIYQFKETLVLGPQNQESPGKPSLEKKLYSVEVFQ